MVHIYEGILSIVRNDIARREQKLEEQEQQITKAAYERQQVKARKLDNRKKHRSILIILAVISLLIFLILYSDGEDAAPLFLVFFIGLLISSFIA